MPGYGKKGYYVFTLSDNENAKWNDRAWHIAIFIATRNFMPGMYPQEKVCSTPDCLYPACDRCIVSLWNLWGTGA